MFLTKIISTDLCPIPSVCLFIVLQTLYFQLNCFVVVCNIFFLLFCKNFVQYLQSATGITSPPIKQNTELNVYT